MSTKLIQGGRIFQVKPSIEQIEENRTRALANARRNRERNIARELKKSGMLPQYPGNPFGGWAGTDHVVRQDTPASLPVTTEDRWQRHLASVNVPELF